MTQEELAKSLLVCGKQNDCVGCCHGLQAGCCDNLMIEAAEVIKRQTARIKELEAENLEIKKFVASFRYA